MPSLVQGRVVYPRVAIPDPQGKNPKKGRPFVVISNNEDIKKGGTIQAIGITTTLDESPSDHQVRLPFGPTARTGLKIESAALCTWLIDIAQDQVDVGKGYIPPDLVLQIVEKVEHLKVIGRPIG